VSIAPRRGADLTRRLGHVSFAATPADPMPADAAALRKLFDAALVLLAADAFGGASRLLEMSVDYAKTREQFGGPIGRFQGLKHQLADAAVDVEPARGLYWYAAHAFDTGAPDASRIAALAKAHLGEVFMRMARTAIEAHGGIGYTWEYDAQIWYKRALFDFAYLGAPSRHRARAAELAGW
jgi:alkylation response protein AidB-like acyl-CoA dehydrogenase